MKYASTQMIGSDEVVAVVLPLEMVPLFNPAEPVQPNTYGVPDDVEIGWVKQADGSFAPPVPITVVPAKCTRRQGQLALLDRDVDALIKVEAFIADIQDTLTRRKAEAEYFADTWERANPFLQVVWAQALDGTPSGLDNLFIDAVTR